MSETTHIRATELKMVETVSQDACAKIRQAHRLGGPNGPILLSEESGWTDIVRDCAHSSFEAGVRSVMQRLGIKEIPA